MKIIDHKNAINRRLLLALTEPYWDGDAIANKTFPSVLSWNLPSVFTEALLKLRQ